MSGVKYLSDETESDDEVQKVKSQWLSKNSAAATSTPAPQDRLSKVCMLNSAAATSTPAPQDRLSKSLNLRSSERIQKKRNRSFVLPSRKELFSEIPSLKSPEKTFDDLKPRKLVNNFMKVTNRYNYDAYDTSGESSIEDFIDNDDEASELSSEESNDDKKVGSSSENETSDKENAEMLGENVECLNDDDLEENISHRKKSTSTSRIIVSDSESSSFSDSVLKSVKNKKRKALRSNSESESSEKPAEVVILQTSIPGEVPVQTSNPDEEVSTQTEIPNESESQSEILSHRKRNTSNIIISDNDGDQSEPSQVSDEEDDGSDEESMSSDDDDGHHSSKRARLMEKRRTKQRRKFEALKQARANKKTPSKPLENE